MDKHWRKGKCTDGPNQDGYYTAGIDAALLDVFGKPDWHLHAIEFHSKDKAETEQRRDVVFSYLNTQPKSMLAIEDRKDGIS